MVASTSIISIFTFLKDTLKERRVFYGTGYGIDAVKKDYTQNKNNDEVELESFIVTVDIKNTKCQEDVNHECDFLKILKFHKAFPSDFIVDTTNPNSPIYKISMAAPKAAFNSNNGNPSIFSKNSKYTACKKCYSNHKLYASLLKLNAAKLKGLNFDLNENQEILDKEMPIEQIIPSNIHFFGLKSFLTYENDLQIQNYVVLTRTKAKDQKSGLYEYSRSLIYNSDRQKETEFYLIGSKSDNNIDYVLFKLTANDQGIFTCNLDNYIDGNLHEFIDGLLDVLPIEKLFFTSKKYPKLNLEENIFLVKNQNEINRCFSKYYKSIGLFNNIPEYVKKKDNFADKFLSQKVNSNINSNKPEKKKDIDNKNNVKEPYKLYIFIGALIAVAAISIIVVLNISHSNSTKNVISSKASGGK